MMMIYSTIIFVFFISNLNFVYAPNTPCVGCFAKIDDVNSKELTRLSWLVLAQMNREQSNEKFHSVPIKILLAESQIVQGRNYNLEILVAKSKCMKNLILPNAVSPTSCQPENNGTKQVCKFSVFKTFPNEQPEGIKFNGCDLYKAGSE